MTIGDKVRWWREHLVKYSGYKDMPLSRIELMALLHGKRRTREMAVSKAETDAERAYEKGQVDAAKWVLERLEDWRFCKEIEVNE